MSKENRTIDDLQNNLDNDYGWRIQELSIIKSKIEISENIETKSLIRAGITILYAHWEGFIKNAASNFINFVSLQRLNNNELNSIFIALSIKSKFNLIISKKYKVQSEAIEFLINEFNKRANVPYEYVIYTGSNLRSTIFKDICFLIGIDYKDYVLQENFIDDQLLGYRNSIAHGEYLIIDDITFYEIYNKTINLINNIKNDILNSAINKNYKREISIEIKEREISMI